MTEILDEITEIVEDALAYFVPLTPPKKRARKHREKVKTHKKTGPSRKKIKGLAAVRKALVKRGVDPELVDINALYDTTLTYKENLYNILDQLGISTRERDLDTSQLTKAERLGDYFYQVGRSHTKRDERRHAKPPGVRFTKHHTRYTERRKSRSDRPGSLL